MRAGPAARVVETSSNNGSGVEVKTTWTDGGTRGGKGKGQQRSDTDSPSSKATTISVGSGATRGKSVFQNHNRSQTVARVGVSFLNEEDAGLRQEAPRGTIALTVLNVEG